MQLLQNRGLPFAHVSGPTKKTLGWNQSEISHQECASQDGTFSRGKTNNFPQLWCLYLQGKNDGDLLWSLNILREDVSEGSFSDYVSVSSVPLGQEILPDNWEKEQLYSFPHVCILAGREGIWHWCIISLIVCFFSPFVVTTIDVYTVEGMVIPVTWRKSWMCLIFCHTLWQRENFISCDQITVTLWEQNVFE